MPPARLTERLFTFLWHRYVEGRSPQEAADLAGTTPEELAHHRARRTPAYEAAEALLDERLPAPMLARYARALQARLLLVKEDATAAGVAKAILEEAQQADRPTAITFVIEDFEAAKDLQRVMAEADDTASVFTPPGDAAAWAAGAAAGPPKASPSSIATRLEYVAVAKAAKPQPDEPPSPAHAKPAYPPKPAAPARKPSRARRAHQDDSS